MPTLYDSDEDLNRQEQARTADEQHSQGQDDAGQSELNDLQSGGFYKPSDETTANAGTAENGDKKDDDGNSDDSKGSFAYRAGKARGKATKLGGLFKDKPNQGRGSKKAKRAAGLLLGTGAGFMVIVAMIIFFFFGSLKTVHFSTVLRSIGFARFNFYMRENYSSTLFDAAVLSGDSTGSFSLESRSLLDKLRRINPEKQLAQLGQEGTLKFNFEGESKWGGIRQANSFKGVEINGRSINLDELAQTKFSKPFSELSRRQTRAIQTDFVRAANEAGLAERLAVEGRAFRSSIYDGLRQATGIKLSKWKKGAKDYKGLTPEEARAKNVEETNRAIENGESTKKSSSNDAINEEAEKTRKAKLEEAKTGVPKPTESQAQKRARIAEINGKAKDVSDVILAATIICIVHDLSNSFQDADKQIQEQALRTGSDALTAGDQIKAGEVEPEAVGANNALYDNAENSIAYKQAMGKPVSDTERSEQSIPDVNGPLGQFGDLLDTADTLLAGGIVLAGVEAIPGVGDLIGAARDKIEDAACTVVLNPYAQAGVAVGEIALTVFSAGTLKGAAAALKAGIASGLKLAGTVGVGELLGTLMERAIASFAGTDFNGTATGPNKLNEEFVGTGLLEETGTRQISYGAPMDRADAIESQQTAMADLKDSYSRKSFTDRYFAMDNPFSLTGNMAAIAPASAGSAVASMVSGVPKLMSSVFNLFQNGGNLMASLFSGRVYAAETDTAALDAGVEPWGWTNEELEKLRTDPEYSVENLEAFVLPQYVQLLNKYSKCYDYELQADRPDECTKDFLSSEEAFKWRAYMSKMYIADMSGTDVSIDPAENSANEGSGTPSTPTAPTAPNGGFDIPGQSNTGDCPQSPHITDAGIVDDAYKSGNGPYSVRMCWLTVNNGAKKIMFNALAVSRFDQLFTAFNAAGYTLNSGNGDGYRTYAQQAAQYKKNPGNFTAPGKSNHQYGVALDITCSGGGQAYGGGKAAPGSADRGLGYFQDVALKAPCLNWIHTNSTNYQLLLQCDGRNDSGQVITGGSGGVCEPWHLSPTGG